MLRHILALAAVFFLCSCEGSSSRSDAINEIAQGLERSIEQAKTALRSTSDDPTAIPKKTAGEIKRMLSVEYKIEEWASGVNKDSVQSKLSDLGRSGWDCFAIHDNGSVIRAYCKRTPSNYLRFAAPLLSGLEGN